MKLFLIKIGKAWHTLRREGLIRGGARVTRSFLALFRRVRPGDILFITGGVGDSARYRTEHVAEELEFRGFKTATTVQDNPFLSSYDQKFSVFVFHRVLSTPSVQKFIEKIKKAGKEIIFETDDLVYDPAFLEHMDYYKVMNPLERKLYEHGVGGEILADPAVRVATTSTHYLAEKLEEKGKKVFLVPNRLSKEDLLWADAARKNNKQEPKKKIRIGYLSGTPSHNKDFATILEPLKALLGDHPEVQLVLAGPLDTGHTLKSFSRQIEILPFAPRKKFFEYVASLDINLAPLEIGNPFCEAKSELKFFEAGIVGVPTVAAATDTYQRAIVDGADGMLATTPVDWHNKLEKLVMDSSLRMNMGEAAKRKALESYTTEKANNEAYYNYLRSKVV